MPTSTIVHGPPGGPMGTKFVREVIDWGGSQVPLQFVDVIDLCGGLRPLRMRDVVEYVLDAVNDETPIGVYYQLDDDNNVVRVDEKETT